MTPYDFRPPQYGRPRRRRHSVPVGGGRSVRGTDEYLVIDADDQIVIGRRRVRVGRRVITCTSCPAVKAWASRGSRWCSSSKPPGGKEFHGRISTFNDLRRSHDRIRRLLDHRIRQCFDADSAGAVHDVRSQVSSLQIGSRQVAGTAPTRARPSVTGRVCPVACQCQLVRAPGAKRRR